MEHEATGLVLIFLGDASTGRQNGSFRLLSATDHDPPAYKIRNGPLVSCYPQHSPSCDRVLVESFANGLWTGYPCLCAAPTRRWSAPSVL